MCIRDRYKTMSKKLFAEFFGTFWLVFGGCGSAIFASHIHDGGEGFGIGLFGVALAFGLTVLTMAYAVGPVSYTHLDYTPKNYFLQIPLLALIQWHLRLNF